MKRLLIVLTLLALLPVWPAAAETAGEGAGDIRYVFDEKGFLLPESDADEFLSADEKNGVWRYASATLSITVNRYREKVKKKTREYCVAEIWASPEDPLCAIMSEPGKTKPAGYKMVSPKLIEDKYRPIFAMSDDMYGIRLHRYKYDGVVIRDGQVMSSKTRNSGKRRAWPNLDTLAVFGDGSMKTFVCDAHTPEEYLKMGALHVFSFGPVLIGNGEVNPTVRDPKYYPYNEPRAAIGMVEPYHYIAVAVRGRPTKQYAGVHLDWLADKMLEMGCVEALNLDGGQTVTMMFNGELILCGDKRLRSQGSMIAFGMGKREK